MQNSPFKFVEYKEVHMQILIDNNNVVISAVTVGGLIDGIDVDDMPSDCAYNPTKYKYVDGNFIPNPDYTNAVSLSDLKSAKIGESKLKLAKWLESNPMLFTDGKLYSVTAEKQSLLNSNLASYERATQAGIEYDLKWNSTGAECEPWDYNDLLTLSLTIAAYVAPKVSMQQSTEVAIINCNTVEELEEIIISYD